MALGAIWLHRQLLECPELADPLALAVWVHLLLRAAHKPAKLPFRGKSFAVGRGQLVTSLRQLEADTKVPVQRLRTILRRFDMADMAKINTAINTAASVITICKYDEYQTLAVTPNTAANSQPTQHQHSTNTQNKNERIKEGVSESESLTESHATREAKPPRAVRSQRAYPVSFEKLWNAYPTRAEDTKPGCFKHWERCTAEDSTEDILAAALSWHREQHANPMRFGLLRWLRERLYRKPAPVYRPNGHGQVTFADIIGAENRSSINAEDEFGAVIEGTRASEPYEAADGGAFSASVRSGYAPDAGDLHRRTHALPATSGNGWMRTVGEAESDVASTGGVARVH